MVFYGNTLPLSIRKNQKPPDFFRFFIFLKPQVVFKFFAISCSFTNLLDEQTQPRLSYLYEKICFILSFAFSFASC